MFKKFIIRMLNKYQWFLNPLAGRRDPLVMLMISSGFHLSPVKEKKNYHVFYEGGRLIGIFYNDFKGDIFNTRLRIVVYSKDEGEHERYRLVYIFTHGNEKTPYKQGSALEFDYVDLAQAAVFLKHSEHLVNCRATVFGFQQLSKVKKIPQQEAT